MRLKAATHDTRMLVSEAHRLLKEIFKPGYRYHKCGVQLSHILPASAPGLDLFDLSTTISQTDDPVLMETIDRINRRFPKVLLWRPLALIEVDDPVQNTSPSAIQLIGESWFL